MKKLIIIGLMFIINTASPINYNNSIIQNDLINKNTDLLRKAENLKFLAKKINILYTNKVYDSIIYYNKCF